MLRRTEGIVLRTRTFGEADLILEYLTRDYGIQSAFAKSPRKIKSRFGGSLEPFTHAKVSFMGREEARLPKLTQSDIIRPFQELRENVRSFLLASEFAELLLKLLPEREPAEKAFELMLWALGAVEKNGEDPAVPLVYKIRLMELTGYAPGFGRCARCGAGAERFYPRDGAVLCAACGKPGQGWTEPSPALVRAYQDLGRWPLDKVGRIRLSDRLFAELKGFIETHIKEHITVSLKTESWVRGVEG